MFDLDNFLKQIANMNISDIHLRVGESPMVRKNGLMIRTNAPKLTKTDMDTIVDNICPEYVKNNVYTLQNYDFLYELGNVSRYRVNFAKSLQNPMLVLRVVPFEAPDFKEKNLPEVLQKICEYNNGIVLVTGPTGCGKSTTLTAMLNYINENYAKHIITIEDPIEFLHTNKKSLFSQRQIGVDTVDYPSAIKYALRQDPDIILIGEIRDRETAKEALSAAETGHLVFATLHTTDAVQTINRVVSIFEPHEREQIRMQFAQILRATISQKLIQSLNPNDRVPAFEILISTPTVRDYIIKDEIDEIYTSIKNGKYADMVTLNMYLTKLVREKIISQETALAASENKNELTQIFKGAYHSNEEKKHVY